MKPEDDRPLTLTEEQLDELHKEASGNSCERARKKCFWPYRKGNGYAHREIAKLVRADETAVTDYVSKYRDGSLPGLLAEHYRKSEGQLDAHTEKVKRDFREQSAAHGQPGDRGHRAENRGVGAPETLRLPRTFLQKLGMKCRRCGLLSGKAPNDAKQFQSPQEFHDNKLQSRLEEARQGKRTVLRGHGIFR